ncbi:hypothetical protein F4782DRAFT_72335 [Xylaria castorea]|nr:hypothetical protein F4782DRAFT_72335 [Xylaria castorea]
MPLAATRAGGVVTFLRLSVFVRSFTIPSHPSVNERKKRLGDDHDFPSAEPEPDLPPTCDLDLRFTLVPVLGYSCFYIYSMMYIQPVNTVHYLFLVYTPFPLSPSSSKPAWLDAPRRAYL